MVDATQLVLLEESLDWALLAKWSEEFQLGVIELNKDGVHTMGFLGLIGYN